MSELETRIRDALRADEIGWDDLREPALRTDTPRSPRRWPAVLATAAAVAVVATVAGVIATNNGTSNTPAGNHPPYAGYTWQLKQVTNHRSTIDVAGAPGLIAFSDTAVSGTLADASIFGHYSPTSNGYSLTDIGFAGTSSKIADGSELRVGPAFASVFVHANGRNLDPNRPASVVAQVTGNRLVLQANGVTLRLDKIGPSGLSPVIDAVGYTWNAVSLTDRQGRLSIPARFNATIGFDRYGMIAARDIIAPVSGRFGLTRSGYVLSDTMFGASGSTGSETPVVSRVRSAVDAMVSSNAAVLVTVNDNTLTLHRNGITLTLDRGDVQPQTRISITEATGSQFSPPAPTPITEPGDSVPATP
jgi:hypothetical protein